MSNGLEELKRHQPLELIPDYLYEDRHEFIEKLAYRLWEERGRPLGSPDIDWRAAELAVNSSAEASGADHPSEEAAFKRASL